MIAVVRGSSGDTIEDLLCSVADRFGRSVRVAGVVAEGHGLADRACNAGYLRNVRSDERFSIFADAGAGSTVCHLDGSGALSASDAVRRDIAAGCDLVILSKFGKLEAAGDGLYGSFRAAIEARIPLLTSVSATHDEAWRALAPSSSVVLPADIAEIDRWWETVRSRTP